MPHVSRINEAVLISSTKTKLIERLEKKYGKNWKTPLSKDLGVHISTVRRVFNQRDGINPVWIVAINSILNDQ